MVFIENHLPRNTTHVCAGMHVCVHVCAGMHVSGQCGSHQGASDGLGQPHAVVGPVEDAVVLADEDVPQDPLLGAVVTLEATGAEAGVLGEARLR